MADISPITVARFWSKVSIQDSTSDCWEWKGTASPSRNGALYGYFRFDGKMVRAPRFCWEMCNQAKIPEGLVVRHKCDNSLCCNPIHLDIGTQKENVADRDTRGRAFVPKGKSNRMSKLKEDDIPEIRKMLSCGVSTRAIAKMFGVSTFPIYLIKKGRGWKHVE